MIYNFIITAILMVAFFTSIGAYCLGLKHGKQLSNNQVPKFNINPVKAVTEAVEQHENKKVAEKVVDDLNNIMEYNFDSALEAVKLERK